MHEIVVNRREVAPPFKRFDQMPPHRDEGLGSAGREVEPADQFLPARLGRFVQHGRRVIGLVLGVSLTGFGEPLAVGPVGPRQRLEEGDAFAGLHLPEFVKDVARERGPRCLTAAGKKMLAELEKRRRARLTGRTARAAGEERAAAVGDRLKHFAEKACVHGMPSRAIEPLAE